MVSNGHSMADITGFIGLFATLVHPKPCHVMPMILIHTKQQCTFGLECTFLYAHIHVHMDWIGTKTLSGPLGTCASPTVVQYSIRNSGDGSMAWDGNMAWYDFCIERIILCMSLKCQNTNSGSQFRVVFSVRPPFVIRGGNFAAT